ncbi:hypothetical protein M0805_008872 [Coniferiporia weirii]|nr:hypothetical protein M0805_008872 [Coniferiporia weirii]
MPPISSLNGGSFTSEAGSCSGSCAQVIVGCVLPLLAVASSIPIMLVRRHISCKHSILRSQLLKNTSRVPATPRAPLNSVYIARVNYYLPAIDTMPSLSVTESDFDEAAATSSIEKEDTRSVSIASSKSSAILPYDKPPMISLPSLPSILCEFTVYADAIESEQLAEAKQSSICLLESVFSSMDVSALSYPAFLLAESPSLGFPATPSSTLEKHDTFSSESGNLPSAYGEDVQLTAESERKTVSPFIMASTLSSVAEEREDDVDLFHDTNGCGPSATHLYDQEIIEEINTSQLSQTTTLWSVRIDSLSTLASLLASRLAEFPSVPTFLPQGPGRGQVAIFTGRRSESSINSTVSYSISAPASLNVLEIRVGDFLPQRAPNVPCLLRQPAPAEPGELWDEEDDLRFSVCLPPKPTGSSKPSRYTWTAGVSYSRSENGELWDDEDDRRFSCMGNIGALATFASLSTILLAVEGDRNKDIPTLISCGSLSLEGQTCQDTSCGDKQSQEPSLSEQNTFASDFGSVEETCYLDAASTDGEEDHDTTFIICTPDFWTSSPSPSPSASPPLHRRAFEDLAARPAKRSASFCSSRSTRSSLMSLASVLDVRVRVGVVDPDSAHDVRVDSSEDLSTKTEVRASASAPDVGVVDMDLEPDHAYSSRIVSVCFTLNVHFESKRSATHAPDGLA